MRLWSIYRHMAWDWSFRYGWRRVRQSWWKASRAQHSAWSITAGQCVMAAFTQVWRCSTSCRSRENRPPELVFQRARGLHLGLTETSGIARIVLHPKVVGLPECFGPNDWQCHAQHQLGPIELGGEWQVIGRLIVRRKGRLAINGRRKNRTRAERIATEEVVDELGLAIRVAGADARKPAIRVVETGGEQRCDDIARRCYVEVAAHNLAGEASSAGSRTSSSCCFA